MEDFEPALDTGAAETSDDAAGIDQHSRQATAEPAPAPRGDNPRLPPVEPRPEPKGRDKARAMFRDLSAKVRAGEVAIDNGSDLVPMEHEAAKPALVAAPAAVATPVPATASPAAQAAAVIPAAVQRPAPVAAPQQNDVTKAAETQRALLLDMREKEIAAREAKLVEREKTVPTSQKLIDAPIPTLAQYIRDSYGITDDAELKDAITDLMTEMSEQYHGVKLPDDIKNRVESRKAVRTVRADRLAIARERAEFATKAEEQRKADVDAREKADSEVYEKRAVSQITGLIEANQKTYPYLAVQDNHAAIVWDVLKERHNRGESTNWAEAAQLADDHFKQQHEASQTESAKRAARLATLLAPVAPVAPAKPAVSPGGAPGPAPTPPAQAATPQLEPKPALADPSDVIVEDHRDARRRSLRNLIAKHGLGADSA